MLLHLLRHADAGDPLDWTGSDAIRPLSEKGRAQADRLGRFLASIAFRADLVASSPRLRARETAEIVAAHLDATVRVDERLGGGLDIEALDALLREAGDPERPVLVGHDPDFSDLVATLCGTAGITVRKGSFVRIDVERPLEAGSGTLRWLLPPDALKPGR
jgi:phosphohistidine phosphatase